MRRQFWTTGIVTLDDVLSPTAAATLKDELLMRTLYTKVRAAYVEAAPATLCVQCVRACAARPPWQTLHAACPEFRCPHADTQPTAGWLACSHPPVLMRLAAELEAALPDVFPGIHLERWSV